MHVIKIFSQNFSSFYLSHVDKNTVIKEIKKLNLNKAAQDSDIPVKILKENAHFFIDYMYLQFNKVVDSSKFADFFKSADISAAYKQGLRNKKKNYSPISILPLISKIFENERQNTGFLFAGNSQITLIIFCQNFNVVLEKATAHNIVSF